MTPNFPQSVGTDMTELHIGGVGKDNDPTLRLTAFERRRPCASATLEGQGEYDRHLLSNRGKFNPIVIDINTPTLTLTLSIQPRPTSRPDRTLRKLNILERIPSLHESIYSYQHRN